MLRPYFLTLTSWVSVVAECKVLGGEGLTL